jgi:selenide,water dikinase
MTATPVGLTTLSHGAGCGCKLPAAELLPIVSALPGTRDPRLLVGAASGDDAAVFAISPGLALVQTVDFFTPVVDDPFDFGRIAAANALSDVYAMGGSPLLALNIVAFPLQRLGGELLRRILEGGAATCAEAGCVVAGGHSIDDPEPKYGLSVTGTVDPDRILANGNGRAGDVLVLTKPIGAGAVMTAGKRGSASAEQLSGAVAVMAALNDRASLEALAAGAHAVTDVTGFGLLGHLRSLTRESGCAATVRADDVEAIEGALQLLADETGVSGGLRANAAYAQTFTTFDPGVDGPKRLLLCDPMTSGGLLVAVPRQRAGEINGAVIGELTDGPAGEIHVV